MKYVPNTGWVCNKYIPSIGWVYNYDEDDSSYEVPVGSITDSFKDLISVPLPPQKNNTMPSTELVEQHSNTAIPSVPISGHIQHNDAEHS